jgi:AcrR family transcriptional regulator
LPTKRAYHHGNLRPTLVSAAFAELAHTGIEGFSLRSIARRAGVSAPAVYRHFQDKDDLLTAVAVECADRLTAALAAARAAASHDPLDRFRATGIAYVRFAVAHPDYFRALCIPGLLDRAPDEQRARLTAWHAAERSELVAAQAFGLIAALPIEELLLAAMSTMHGLAHFILAGQFGPVDDAKATQMAIAATAAVGVGFWPRTETIVDPLTGLAVAGKR